MSDKLETNPLREVKRVVGSREPIWGVIAKNDKSAVDLTDETVVCRVVRQGTGDVVIDNQEATIAQAEAGKVYYEPTEEEAEALTIGRYACYFLIDGSPPRRFPYDGPKFVVVVVPEFEAADEES